MALDIGEADGGCLLLRDYLTEYRVFGSGPSIVLLPGLAGGMGLVRPLVDALANHFRVFTYEYRGELDGWRVGRRATWNDLLLDLGAFLEEMRLERPILLGVSFGGAIALDFASRQPGRVSALVVQGVDVRLRRSLLEAVAAYVLNGFPLPSDRPAVNQYFHLLFGRRQRDRAVFDFVTRQCWKTDQAVMAHRFRLIEQLDLEPRLSQIQVPTLMVSGKHDLFVSRAGLEEMQRRIPCVRHRHLSNAGHLAFVTHAERMAEWTSQFAERLGLRVPADATSQ